MDTNGLVWLRGKSVEARFSLCEREGNAEQRSSGEAEKRGRGNQKDSIFIALEFQYIICVPCVHLWLVYLLRAPSFLRGFVFPPPVISGESPESFVRAAACGAGGNR